MKQTLQKARPMAAFDGHTVMTVQEAERLGVYCPNFFAVYDLVRSIARTRGCSDVGSPNEWNTMTFLCSIYNAGRVDGIRAERAKRKGKCPVHPL